LFDGRRRHVRRRGSFVGRRTGRRVQIGNRVLKCRLGRWRRGKLLHQILACGKFRLRVLARLFAPGIAAFAITLPIAPAAAAAATASPVVTARFAGLAAMRLAMPLAMPLVLRTIAFDNISSATVLITVGLRPKFLGRFDRGFACGDILIFRGQIAGLPDRDVLDAV
jgi:hypothetical protein